MTKEYCNARYDARKINPDGTGFVISTKCQVYREGKSITQVSNADIIYGKCPLRQLSEQGYQIDCRATCLFDKCGR